jgi:hypothetical protein
MLTIYLIEYDEIDSVVRKVPNILIKWDKNVKDVLIAN